MGSSYTPMKANGATQKQIEFAYARIKTHEVIEATKEIFFQKRYALPPASEVEDIEIGDDVSQTWVKFKSGDWIVFKGKMNIETILKHSMR